MNIWYPFTIYCHVNAEHKIKYNDIFFKKKKINTICIVQRNICAPKQFDNQYYSTYILSSTSKEMHPVLELFWVNFPFKCKPHPTDDFIGQINQAVSHLSRKVQCCWQDQWNLWGRVCAELVWEEITCIKNICILCTVYKVYCIL